MRLPFVFFLLLCTAAAAAQNLTGVWRGKRTQGPEGCFPEYSLELHIQLTGENTLAGNAWNFTSPQEFTKIHFTGRYNPQTRRLVLIEKEVLQYQVPANCTPCIKTYQLYWSAKDTTELLLGEWTGHEMGNGLSCSPGKISLSRQSRPSFPVDILQNDTLSVIQQQIQVQQREKELVQTLHIDSPHIKVELYDNAEIDDDTVSIFLNNTLLLYKKRLTDKALRFTIEAFPNTDYELMMYAENLGRIPPNTSLMIITAGNKRYELRLASSKEKSAVVRFRYTP